MKDCSMELTRIKDNIISILSSITIGQEDAHEVGEVVDMLKDICEAEKYCAETCYYNSVIDAMGEVEPHNERMGYNSRHYANGKFAPSGSGTRMGYKPYLDQEPYIDDYINHRMGYTQDPKDVKMHIQTLLMTLKDFYENGDTQMKKQIKMDMQNLINDMPN